MWRCLVLILVVCIWKFIVLLIRFVNIMVLLLMCFFLICVCLNFWWRKRVCLVFIGMVMVSVVVFVRLNCLSVSLLVCVFGLLVNVVIRVLVCVVRWWCWKLMVFFLCWKSCCINLICCCLWLVRRFGVIFVCLNCFIIVCMNVVILVLVVNFVFVWCCLISMSVRVVGGGRKLFIRSVGCMLVIWLVRFEIVDRVYVIGVKCRLNFEWRFSMCIIMVKKVFVNGEDCCKCKEV